jgi:hypothetical protein
MNKKKKDWDKVAWTKFMPCSNENWPGGSPRPFILKNSIYQVAVWCGQAEPFGEYFHLSIKTHDKQPRHDWRELQRIKNEIIGPEYEAVEVYPAESRLVDTSNQYHLFVFTTFKLPFGFKDRMVVAGSTSTTGQREFPPGLLPADAIPAEKAEELMKKSVTPPVIGSKET